MANKYKGKMLSLKGDVIAVSIDDKAMIIDFNKSPKKHFTLSPDSGCFLLELLVKSKKEEEVTFDEMVDCVKTRFKFAAGEDAETGVANFLDLLDGENVLEQKDAQRAQKTAKDILKNITGGTKGTNWTKASISPTGSWIGGFPTWYP